MKRGGALALAAALALSVNAAALLGEAEGSAAEESVPRGQTLESRT